LIWTVNLFLFALVMEVDAYYSRRVVKLNHL
jgi:hypothetical protein